MPQDLIIVEVTDGDGSRPVPVKADRWTVRDPKTDDKPRPTDGMLQLYRGAELVAEFPFGAWAGVYKGDAL